MTIPTHEELLEEASKKDRYLADLIRIKNVVQYTKKKPILPKGYYYDSRDRKRKINSSPKGSLD